MCMLARACGHLTFDYGQHHRHTDIQNDIVSTRAVLRLVWPSLLLLFIERWRHLAGSNDPNFINKEVFKNLIGSLGYHQNLTHCWHRGTRHTCTVWAEQYGDMSSDGHKKTLILFLFNWVTGSPPKFDTLLASWYPTYMQSFIISHSSCVEQYGDMSSDGHKKH